MSSLSGMPIETTRPCGTRGTPGGRLLGIGCLLQRNDVWLLRLGERQVQPVDHRDPEFSREFQEPGLDDRPVARRKGYRDYLVRHLALRYNAEPGAVRDAPDP